MTERILLAILYRLLDRFEDNIVEILMRRQVTRARKSFDKTVEAYDGTVTRLKYDNSLTDDEKNRQLHEAVLADIAATKRLREQ